MSIVSLVTPDESQLLSDFRHIIEDLLQPLGGLTLAAGEKALLYMGHIWPAPAALGVNPHPVLLTALVESLYQAGAGQVQLAAGAAPGFDFAACWQMAGYQTLDSYGAYRHDLATCPKSERHSRLDLACPSLAAPLLLLQADYLINVGKFRVANAQIFGAAMLNLAAAAELPQPPHLFARALVDLHSIIMPDLHILDAIKGQQGYQPQQQHAILAATDAPALDTTLAVLAGLKSGEIEHLALAAQYGMGCTNAGDIKIFKIHNA